MAPIDAVFRIGTGVLLAGIVWLGVRLPGAPTGVQAGDARRMSELARYLEPVQAPALDAPTRGPVGDPFRQPLAPVPETTRPRPAAGPRVSAILIAGERRLAILDDRVVRPGDVLGDGTRVAAIGPREVTLVAPDGTRRVLRIETGEGS